MKRSERIAHRGVGHRVKSAAVFVAALVALATGALADSVRLRSTVVLDANQPVVLSDIAVLEGDEALAAAGAVIAPIASDLVSTRDGVARVSMDRVRRVLRDSGVMVARIGISGNECIVRLRGVAKPVAEEEKKEEEPEPRAFQTVHETGLSTVRTRVVEAIARTYGTDRDGVRVLFDPRDEELLAIEEGGQSVIVRPVTTSSSSRPLVDVRVIAGERTVASGMVSAEVEVRRRVVVAVGDIARHCDTLEALVRTDDRWMAPSGAVLVESTGAVVGQRASRRIRAGEVLRASDLEGVLAVLRGEVVSVVCIRNGVSVQTRARAQGDGRIGDRVECRIEGSRKSFVGTVDAVGRVVVDVSGTGA
mgnify:CR=1 FL=1